MDPERASWKVAAAKHAIGEVLGVDPAALTDNRSLVGFQYPVALRVVAQAEIMINPDQIRTVGDVLKMAAEDDD